MFVRSPESISACTASPPPCYLCTSKKRAQRFLKKPKMKGLNLRCLGQNNVLPILFRARSASDYGWSYIIALLHFLLFLLASPSIFLPLTKQEKVSSDRTDGWSLPPPSAVSLPFCCWLDPPLKCNDDDVAATKNESRASVSVRVLGPFARGERPTDRGREGARKTREADEERPTKTPTYLVFYPSAVKNSPKE